MSQLRVNTLSDLAGTNSPDVTRGEFCRARFNLNGTSTIALRDSFNIASVIDNGTGDYTTTFSNAFLNADYSCSFGTIRNPSTGQTAFIQIQLVDSLRFEFVLSNVSYQDTSVFTANIHGDKS